ncbi:hypothetical protein [Salinibacillus aidingensis]
MKKYITLFSIVIIIITILYLVWYAFPKNFNSTFNGILFNLDDPDVEENVSIYFDGTIRKRLNGEMTYDGIVRIKGDKFPVPKGKRDLIINFDKNGMGLMTYMYYTENGEPKHYVYGTITLNEDLTKLTILRYRNNGSHGSWTKNDGDIISAPATTRKEALKIADPFVDYHLQQREK